MIRTPDDNPTSAGLVTLDRCNDITLKNLHLEAIGQFGVMILGNDGTALTFSANIVLENLDISTTRNPAAGPANASWIPTASSPFPLATVAAYYTTRLAVLGCTLTMAGDRSASPERLPQHLLVHPVP